jgi:hypothetical protein
MDTTNIEGVMRQMVALAEYVTHDLPWSKHLTSTERLALLADLLQACVQAYQTGQTDALRIVLEEWEETADLVSHPEVVAQAQMTIPEQDLVAWETVRDALPGRATP